MSIDPNIVKNLPDSELIKATQGQGSGVPGWLAASELSSRNNIRQSAPQQAPQSTVIQGVVANALRSSGIVGGPQQPQPQTMQPAPPQGQQQGIQGTPARMSKGGPVKLAGGGQSDMIPQTSDITYNPVTYNPAITPDATTLADATAKIAPLYGKGPDFEGTLRNVQGLKAPTPNQGLGNWLTNLVAGMAGETKGNAVNAFGTGLQNAQQLANQGQQQGFANKLAQQKEALGIQTEEQKRQSDIADATTKYYNAHATVLDNQARAAAENARGNSQGALQAQEAQQRATIEKAQAARDFATQMGNPLVVAAQLGQAKANGDQAGIALYTDALQTLRGQQQATSDIEQHRQQALQKDMADRQRSVEQMKLAGELRNKIIGEVNPSRSLMELPPLDPYTGKETAMPTTPPGKENIGPTTKTPAGAQSPITAHGIDSAPGNENDSPASRLDTSALNWIKTENSGIGMRGGNSAFQFNLATQAHAINKLYPKYGISPDMLGGIRAAYRGANTEYNKISSVMGPINAAEQTINLQLPNLVAMAHKLKDSGVNLNAAPDQIKKVLGENGYVAYNLALSTLPNEYAVVLDKGNATEGTRDEQRKNFSQSLGSGGIDSLADQVKFETEQRVQGYEDEMANAKNRMGIKSLVDFVKKGVWDKDPGVVERENLPEGKGNPMSDAKVANKFLIAAGNKLGNGNLHDPTVQQEALKLSRVKGWSNGR